MFLSDACRSWVTPSGLQMSEGPFLVLMAKTGDPSEQYRGLVRFVKLKQSGHFLVGTLLLTITCRLYRVPLIGSYGAKGPGCEVPSEVYALGTDLPEDLRVQLRDGGGHNSVGKEALAMDAWAKALKWPASSYEEGRKR